MCILLSLSLSIPSPSLSLFSSFLFASCFPHGLSIPSPIPPSLFPHPPTRSFVFQSLLSLSRFHPCLIHIPQFLLAFCALLFLFLSVILSVTFLCLILKIYITVHRFLFLGLFQKIKSSKHFWCLYCCASCQRTKTGKNAVLMMNTETSSEC